MKKIFLFAVVAFIASACGGLTQGAPPATKSKAKVSINLPKGVSLKPGGTIEPGDPKFHAATITDITLTVTAADIATPITGIIPLNTLELTLDIPSGLARTFTVVVKTDTAGSFYGSQTVDLAADTAMDLAMSVTVVNIPAAPAGVSVTPGDGQAALNWTAVAGADSYNVYYGTAAGVTPSNGTLVAGATSGGAITGLTNGTTYYFVVTAANTSGESAISAEASATPQDPAPGVPAGLSATPGDGQAVLSWTAVAGAVSYNIYRSTASGIPGALLGTSSAASYTDLAVVNGTTYYYSVTAVTAGGESAGSTQVSATPQALVPAAPGAPMGVSATSGNSQVSISWTALAEAASYNVYYSTAAGVTPSSGTLVKGAISGGAIAGLTNGTTYYFVVTAVNAGGEGAFSTQVSATPQVPAPGAPGGLAALAGDAAVGLSWTAVSSIPNATITYAVYRSTILGTQGMAVASALTGPSYADTAVINGTAYYYSVTASDAGGESPASAQVQATPQVAAPGVPAGVTVSSNNGQITVGWNAVTGAATYNVYYSTASGVTTASPTKVTGSTTTSATIGGLNSGTTYYFIVTAANAGGESAASTQVSTMFNINGNVNIAVGPVIPTGVSATAGNGQAVIGWNATGAAASYNVYYGTASGVTTASPTKLTGVTATSATITGLTNGTAYYFVVTAVDASGESGLSSQVSATPQIALPAAPSSGLAATGGNGQAAVSWTAVAGAASYNVYYTSFTGTTPANGTKITGAVSGGAITGLAAGTTYFFVVTAVNALGEGPASAQVSATTIPAAPAGVTVTAGAGQSVLHWNPVNGASSYNVYYSTSSGVTTATGTKVGGVYSGSAITGLAPLTTYYFVVTATGAGGEGAASGEVSAATPSGTPAGVSASAGNGSATVSWTAVAGAASYNVYYGTATGVTTANGTKVTGATSGGAIGGLTNGTTYYFIVTSVYVGGESLAGTEVSAMPFNPSGAWTAKASMPNALMGLSASSINGTVYAAGGEVYGVNCANATVNAYDPSTNIWASKAAMLTARSGLGTAVVNGELYAIGGHGSGANCYVYHNATEMYEPATNAWTAKAAMPTARTLLSAVAVNGVIYAIGGTTNLSASVATVEAYDTVTNTWSTKASMPLATRLAAAAVVNGIVYVIGGTPDGTTKFSTVQAYDPATNTWTTKAAMPTARDHLSGAAVNGKIYVIGGRNASGAVVATVEAYDPSSDTWSTVSSLPVAQAYFAATPANGIVYSLGGTSWVPYATFSTATAFAPGGYIAPVAGVTAAAASTQNTISWTPYAGATSYNIYWSAKNGVSKATATKIPGVASGYVHTGLTSGTRYYYVVTAITAGGETTFGDEVSPVQQPLTPAGVSAAAGNGSAAVSWTASAGAAFYNVYYKTTAGVTTANGTKVTGATSGGAITGLTNGTPYYFVVTAVNAGGESAVSSEVSATPQVPAPATPGGLAATAGNAQVSLTWAPVAAIPNATITYTVYRSTVSGTVGAAIASSLSATSYADTTAANGTTYFYSVAAVDAGGASAASSQTSATPVAPPATPTGVSTSPGNALAVVSWTASSGAASYNVYYRTTTGVTTANGTKVTGATSGGLITGLTNGTPYYFVVTAVNASGESAASSEVSVTPQVPAPGIPGVLAATPGNNQVSLVWTAVAAVPNATITYTVYRSTVTGTVGAAIASSISVLSYTDTTAVNGTTYYYNVAAADAGGTSGASSQAAATPQVPTPGIPAGLAATAGNTQVGLTWTAVAAVPNATITYTVYRSTAAGTVGAAIASSISAASYTDTTAVNGTAYYYNVASADAGGTSAASAQVSATPQVPAPATPGGLAATAGNAEVVLTWTAVAAIPNATITYTVYRSTAIGSQGTAIASAVSPAFYTDTTAVNGTTYYYRVVAVDAGGSSAASSQVSAVPQVPVPGAPRFAYVANYGSNTVSVYTINQTTGALIPATPATVAAGTGPLVFKVDPTGRFAYVANFFSANVSVYTINQTTGALTAGTAVAAGANPHGIAIDPSGKFAYAANNGSNTVSVYSIDQTTGALTAGTPATVAAGTTPVSITIDPSGRFAYVANLNSANVSAYTINQTTGALTAGTPATVAAGAAPRMVTVDPAGKFAYVANADSNTVSVYTIDQTTGALTPGTAVVAGTNPWSVTVDPSGKFAYVGNYGSNTVSVYTINQSTGALTAVGTPVASGSSPYSVTVDPSGKFAYVANRFSNNVSVYTINQTTGALTPATPATVAAEAEPGSTAVTAGVAKPLAPIGVSATAGNGQASLSWTYVAGATSYNVYYRTATGVTIANGTKVTGATNGAAITGLTNGTPYYFVVTAVNATGESVASSEVSATPQVPAPSAPTSPSATAGDTQVTVSWTAPAGTVTSYNIYYGTATGISTASTKVTGATSGGAVTGLTNGTAYYFVVTAVNAGGEGTLSSEVSATPQIPAPSAPTGVTTTISSGSVALSWTAVSGATSYNIYRSTTSGVLGTLIGTSASASYADTTAVNGTTYYYTITAVNAGGESVAGTAVSAIPLLIMGGAIQNGGVALNNAATASTVAVSTLAGTALAAGTTDATGSAARFGRPYGITTDGTYLFVADQTNNTIRKIVISTGVVTTLAGSGVAASTDGTGAGASFNSPTGITTDGTNLFVTDRLGHAIRKIVVSTGVVTTVAGSGVAGAADGTGTAASFNNPNGIVTDGANLYIADQVNGSVRKIVIATGVVTTFASGFTAPRGITTDGTNLYVANSGGNIIQKIVISTGLVTTLAGSGAAGSADGTGTAATFKLPLGITTDGTNLYVVDNNNYTIRQIVISTGAVSTIAGAALAAGSTDGLGSAARFKFPNGITTNGSNLFVADGDNFTIRKIAPPAIYYAKGAASPWGIYSANLDGTGETLVASITSPNQFIAGRYTAAARKLCFASSTGVQTMNGDGTGLATVPNTAADMGGGNDAACDPTGTQVVYAGVGGITTNMKMNIINVDGTGKVLWNDGSASSQHQLYPSWNSAGTIFFGISNYGNAYSQATYSKPSATPTTAPVNLTAGCSQYPDDHVAGAIMVYGTCNGTVGLWVANKDGTAASQLTTATAGGTQTRFQQSTGVIYYLAGGNIWKINSNNTGNTQVTTVGSITYFYGVDD